MAVLKAKQFLVLESDAVCLRAVLIKRRGRRVAIARRAEHPGPIEVALPALLQALRAEGHVPRPVVLATAEAAPGLLELPAGTSEADRAEMLRWELEPVVAGQTMPPPLVAIREALRLRIGAEAEELADLVQQQWPGSDEELVCTWRQVGVGYLAAGMSAARLNWWRQALAAQELSLAAVVPLLTAGLAAPSAPDSGAVVEAVCGTTCVSRLEGGAVVELNCAAHDYSLLPAGLAERAAGASELGALAAQWRAAESDSARRDPEAADGPLLGAARVACGLSGATVALSALPAAVPLYRRSGTWGVAALLLLAGLLAAAVVRHERELDELQQQVDRTGEALGRASERRQQAESAREARRQRAAEAAELRAERERLAARLRVRGELQPERHAQVCRALAAVAAAVNDGLVIERLHRDADSLRISGWAASERDAQRFAGTLPQHLPLTTVDAEIRHRPGPLSRAPYHYAFTFTAAAAEARP